jgi:hypothetical protein
MKQSGICGIGKVFALSMFRSGHAVNFGATFWLFRLLIRPAKFQKLSRSFSFTERCFPKVAIFGQATSAIGVYLGLEFS